MQSLSYWLILGATASFCGAARADRVDDYLQHEIAARRIPGVVLTIIKNGAAVKTSGYGLSNIELQTAVKPETVFEIGSLTKQFTAAGILLLAQQGKVTIDEKIGRYLRGTPPAWRDITVRHLLTHTSGIASYTGLDGFELRRHLTQEQFIQKIGTEPLEFHAGAAWKYCNTGYNLLGYIIENVSGEGYWNFMSERVFGPLGMTATTNRLPALIIPNRAAGYEQTNRVLINRDYDLTDVFSAGAVVSTVLDLARWNSALDSDVLLDAKSKAMMWAPMMLSNGKATKYGFGWFIDTLDGHQNIGHSGSTSGFSATLQRFPQDKLTVIILTNTDEQIATTLAVHIAGFYLE